MSPWNPWSPLPGWPWLDRPWVVESTKSFRHCGITTIAGISLGVLRIAVPMPTSVCCMPSSPRCRPREGKDDRPSFVRRPILGNVDLVFIVDALQGDGAVEEAGFTMFCLSRGRSGSHRARSESSLRGEIGTPSSELFTLALDRLSAGRFAIQEADKLEMATNCAGGEKPLTATRSLTW